MKKKPLLSFLALLLISSAALSQGTDESNLIFSNSSSEDQSPPHSSPHRFESAPNALSKQSELILAKSKTEMVNSDALPQPFSDVNNGNQARVNKNVTQTKKFSDEELKSLRQLFLQAEAAIKKNQDIKYFLLADQLKDYPLHPYLQYQWLKKHLNHKAQIKEFLEQHKSSRYAKRLKRKWLYHLAKHEQWPLFLQNYSTSKETKLSCYHRIAQLNTSYKQAALKGAKELWGVGYSQPHECDPLFAQLKKSSLFTQDLLWQRFDAALQNNKVSLAVYVKNLMPQAYHSTAQLWIKLHQNPSRYLPRLLDLAKTAQSALMFNHAINRLANSDITNAIKIWDANKQAFNIDKKSAGKLEKRLAFKLAFEREAGAYQRFSQLDTNDYSSRTWRVRVALSEQNWQNVLTAIRALNKVEIKKEKWQYWLARAYLETGVTEKAQIILTSLSTRRSYYGYLAADRVNNLYQLSDNPVNISTEEIARLKYRQEYRVAFELMKLGRETEAKLQWWHALRQLNKNEIITAAKLAQQWQWDEIAIFTIAKAKYWDDIELRFPLSFAEKIHENSKQQNLNPVILFGLIRRESAFNEKALSPAGARGLMQIMPQTGRQIAKHFNEDWRGSNSLYDPVTNLKYGSYYYQKLLTQFDGNYAIALAAYNAGPHRVKKWLPETGALPADIWIETIPFYETREYVKNVLAYALIYQLRKQDNELSMNHLTQDVLPLTATP
jgi:soluble lytic murein transglycosylase